jgi:putative ATPase
MDTINTPLAVILRPKNIDDIIGQAHLVGPDGFIRKLIKSGFLPSLILWGPPGCGKTTLAEVLAHGFEAEFESKSAVTVNLEELRLVIKNARERLTLYNRKTVLFIDEIHRFNKAQQDALLPHVENGTVTFIGATTENPSFEVIAPLLSRCRVLVLNQLSESDLEVIMEKGLKAVKKKIAPSAKEYLLKSANGDARILLTIIEIAAKLEVKSKILSKEIIAQAGQKKMLEYDDGGDKHYNTISAFIKSLRASDTDAALYYLARMIASGEDPLYISRRMIVFASEDIGVAQPTALVVANTVFDACHKIGYPECQENLAHGVVYLCQAKKDRSAYDAYMLALSDVNKYGNLPIPMSIRNAPTKLMKDLGYGKGYDKYTRESLLPDKIKGKKYYNKIEN